jgi:two-component system, sensor histidine kinase and response regulator
MVSNSNQDSILVVDDTLANLRLLVQMLQEQGYKVLPARGGQLALQAARSNPPDLILLDVDMPEMNGYEVCQQLKEDTRTQDVPVIFISAMDDVSDRVKGFEVGGTDYIGKPFQAEEVLARVHTHLTLYHLQRKLEAQNARMEADLRLREDMANMIVHDMRNPLAAIIGYAQLLRIFVDTPKCSEYIDAIWTQADRLNAFLNDMLVLAKMETGRPILNYSTVNVNQFVLETLENHSVLAEARNIHFATELPQHSPSVSLDPNLFQRVLDNLISNALKYSPAAGTVTLQVAYPPAGDERAAGVASPENSVCIRRAPVSLRSTEIASLRSTKSSI